MDKSNKTKGLLYIKVHGDQGLYLVKQIHLPETESGRQSVSQSGRQSISKSRSTKLLIGLLSFVVKMRVRPTRLTYCGIVKRN